MKNMLAAPALIGAAILAVVSTPAYSGTKDDVRDLQERVGRLEQSNAKQTVRIGQLENQIQTLTGQIEELTFQLDLATQRLDAVSAALAGDDVGAAALQDANPSASGPMDLTARDAIADQIRNDATPTDANRRAASTVNSNAPSDVSLPMDPDAAYNYASQFLLQGDYARAKAAFKLYVDAFPNHSRTPDAQFRLGEIYLALGENASAADAFIAHIRKYPNDPRAAEAYLKLGTAFARLDKPDEACTVFKTMKSKYPNAGAAVMQRANIEMTRIDCQ